MKQLTDEIANNRLDYDEYYNQLVYIPSHQAAAKTYGQNFGNYYSQFFNPGSDNLLGYECNDHTRNTANCIVIRTSLDKQTGQNPYSGKPVSDDPNSSNAFCGSGACGFTTKTVDQLYLISADSKTKTIFARERIGGSAENPIWAISKVKMSGNDENNDGAIDHFSCADGYECGQTAQCQSADNIPGGLPRQSDELSPSTAQFDQSCDNSSNGFIHDFVPISPLKINIKSLSFQISPVEDPQYAFSEINTQKQPQVTISLTVEPNQTLLQDAQAFSPFTITSTVATQTGPQIIAPIKVQ